MAHTHLKSSTLHHQLTNLDYLTSVQAALPSQTPSGPSELIRNVEGDTVTYDIASEFARNSQLAEKGGYVVVNNREETDEAERWQDEVDALQRSHGVPEASTRKDAVQATNAANSTGGDDAASGGSQTIPSTPRIPAVDRSTTPDPPDSAPTLQRVSESRPEGEANDARNEDTSGREPRPATGTTSGPSTHATRGDYNPSLDHIISDSFFSFSVFAKQ
jgi:hypothetical protein